jgi:hypothetical protein
MACQFTFRALQDFFAIKLVFLLSLLHVTQVTIAQWPLEFLSNILARFPTIAHLVCPLRSFARKVHIVE